MATVRSCRSTMPYAPSGKAAAVHPRFSRVVIRLSAPSVNVRLADAEVIEDQLEDHAVDGTHAVDRHPHGMSLLEPCRDRLDRQRFLDETVQIVRGEIRDTDAQRRMHPVVRPSARDGGGGHGRIEDAHGNLARSDAGVVGDSAAFDDGDLDIRMDLSDQPRQAFHEDIPASADPAG